MVKFHLDGSEISWLVYADWLDDQNLNGSKIRFCFTEAADTYEFNDYANVYSPGSGRYVGADNWNDWQVGYSRPGNFDGGNSIMSEQEGVGADGCLHTEVVGSILFPTPNVEQIVEDDGGRLSWTTDEQVTFSNHEEF